MLHFDNARYLCAIEIDFLFLRIICEINFHADNICLQAWPSLLQVSILF